MKFYVQRFSVLPVVTLFALLFCGCPEMASQPIDVKACLASVLPKEPQKDQPSSNVYALSTKLWQTRAIPVCWEDVGFVESQEYERQVVRTHIETEWENRLFRVESVPPEYQFHFEGWTRCSQGHNTGIRIRVSDEQPYTIGLGTQLAGVSNGMLLNLTFLNWSKWCSGNRKTLDQCIGSSALHEFGHALGLAHEQNRDDTPAYCDSPKQGHDGDTPLGDWDLFSVMNYCSPEWNNNGKLSRNDVYWVRVLYYPEWAEANCLPPLSSN